MRLSKAKKNQKNKHFLVQDIYQGTLDKTINLRKKIPIIQIHFDELWKSLKNNRRHILSVVTIFLFLAIISTFGVGKASIANFYPSSCLGGWEHPENAEGKPDLSLDSKPEDFNIENSARLQQSNSSIYCGGFNGDIPENSKPSYFKLSLSWSVDGGDTIHLNPDVDTPASIDGGVIDQTVPETVVPDSEDNEAPTENSDTESPISLFKSFFNLKVFAQEVEEVSSVENPVVVEPIPLSDTTVEAPVDTAVPNETEIQDSTTTSFSNPSDAFVEVAYTLDGTNWNSLGTVSRNHWQDASFDIPLDAWDNLDHLQVSLTTLQSIDSQPTIYLDAIDLSVEYENIEGVILPPTVLLKDNENIISGKSDFTSSEDVTFTVNSPDFDIADVKNLVDDGKAEVVKDIGGVFNSDINSVDPTQSVNNAVDSVEKTIDQKTKELIESAPNVLDNKNIDASPVSLLKNIFSAKVANAEITPIIAEVIDSGGQLTDISVEIVETLIDGVKQNQIKINKPERSFEPGKYTLKVTFNTPQAIFVSKQDFTWGVLSINFNKTVYEVGDNAYLQMGVLNDAGHTICDADLSLLITAPDGQISNLKTSNGSITRAPECGPDNVIDVPDYYAHFSPEQVGSYKVDLTAITSNGSKKVSDTFSVVQNSNFIIERIGPTRIYPVANYPMTLQVTSNDDWNGVVTEEVPASFDILQPEHSQNYDFVETSSDEKTKIISWKVSLLAGEKVNLGYIFDAPDISPEYYILGKAKFTNEDSIISFEETRNWQIASDAACNATGSGTWSTTANFTSCTGAASAGSGTGNRPGVNDTLTINAGVALVADTTITITSITIAAQTTNTTALAINNGVTLGTSGTFRFTAGITNSVTSTVDIGSGALSVGGLLTIASGAALGRISQITMSTGTLTASAGITFSGTGTPTLNNTGAGTINLTGTIGSGGTVTINSGTTLRTTGTTTLTGNYGYQAVSIDSGTTTQNVNGLTFSGNLSVASGATFTLGNGAFTASGTTNVSGTISCPSGASCNSVKTFTGAVTINSGGVFDLASPAPSIVAPTSFAGGITMNGTTFNSGTGATTFSTSQTLSGSSAMTFGGATAISAGGTLTNSNTSTVTFSSNVTVAIGNTGMSLTTASSTVISGTLAFTANSTAGSSQLITMNGTASLTPTAITMPATTSTGTAKITCASGATGTVTVSGLTSIAAGATASAGTSSIDFGTTSTACNLTTGTLTITGGSVGTALLKMGTGTLTVNGNVTFSGTAANAQLTTGATAIILANSTFDTGGTLSIASATVSVSGTSSFSGAYTLPTLTITGGTTTINATTTVTGALSVSTGATLRFVNVAFTASGTTNVSGTISCPAASTCNGLKTFTGAVTINSGGVFDLVTSSTVATTSFANGITMNGTTFNSGTGATTFSTSQTLSGSSAMTFGGAISLGSGITLINSNTGTVTFSSDFTIAVGNTGLSLSTGSTTNISGTLNFTANSTAGSSQSIIMNGTASLSSGTLTMPATTSTGTAKITCASGASGTYTISSSGSTSTITGSATASGGTSGIDFGTVSSACNLTSGGNPLAVTGGSQGTALIKIGTGTITNTNQISLAGTAANAQFTVGSGTIVVGNLLTLSGGTVSTSSATLNTQTSSTINGISSVANLNVISNTFTLPNTFNVSGTTNISGGTLDTSNANNYAFNTGGLTIGASGTFLPRASTVTMTGNWSNSGTFTPATSTVVMNGGATVNISGTTTFNNLTITHSSAKEVNFATAGTPIFNVTGLFTATGNLGGLIKLYSDSAGTKWQFYPTGTASIDYVDVKDGGCQSGSISLLPNNFTNSGNNESCWISTSLTFSISDASIGFGTLLSSATRYATGDALGSSSEVEANNLSVSTTATSGYSLSVLGNSLFNGSHYISAIGGSNTAPSVGTEQFGIRLTATGGSGVVSAPYTASGFAYAGTSSNPSTVASASSGDGVSTTYSARYMCNISSITDSGDYSTGLIYVVTGNF